jgi:Flp pilus assembly protein TadG
MSIEFAIVGPVFLMLLLAIFELGYMVYVQSILDSSARSAARLIRTGQVQANANPQQYFQSQLCNTMTIIGVSCSSLLFNVGTYSTWSTAYSSVTQPGRNTIKSDTFSPGSAGSIVVVQVVYTRNFITPWVGGLLSHGLGTAFLTSTVVFENEPFPVSTS